MKDNIFLGNYELDQIKTLMLKYLGVEEAQSVHNPLFEVQPEEEKAIIECQRDLTEPCETDLEKVFEIKNYVMPKSPKENQSLQDYVLELVMNMKKAKKILIIEGGLGSGRSAALRYSVEKLKLDGKMPVVYIELNKYSESLEK